MESNALSFCFLRLHEVDRVVAGFDRQIHHHKPGSVPQFVSKIAGCLY